MYVCMYVCISTYTVIHISFAAGMLLEHGPVYAYVGMYVCMYV